MAVILAKKPLPGGVSFTQDMQDRFVYSNPVGFVSGEIHSDKAGTLYLEESDDAGTTWTQTATTTVSAGTTTSLPWTKLTKRWFRFRYKNGAASQGSFILLQQVEGMGFALPSSSGALTTQLTGSNAFQSGNPYSISKDCTLANTNYDIDVNAGLTTRNGHFGLLQAHENNTGVVSVWISFNGTTFTASPIARLQAGDALSLDGLDIDTIRVQSTVAGDSVLGGVW